MTSRFAKRAKSAVLAGASLVCTSIMIGGNISASAQELESPAVQPTLEPEVSGSILYVSEMDVDAPEPVPYFEEDGAPEPIPTTPYEGDAPEPVPSPDDEWGAPEPQPYFPEDDGWAPEPIPYFPDEEAPTPPTTNLPIENPTPGVPSTEAPEPKVTPVETPAPEVTPTPSETEVSTTLEESTPTQAPSVTIKKTPGTHTVSFDELLQGSNINLDLYTVTNITGADSVDLESRTATFTIPEDGDIKYGVILTPTKEAQAGHFKHFIPVRYLSIMSDYFEDNFGRFTDEEGGFTEEGYLKMYPLHEYNGEHVIFEEDAPASFWGVGIFSGTNHGQGEYGGFDKDSGVYIDTFDPKNESFKDSWEKLIKRFPQLETSEYATLLLVHSNAAGSDYADDSPYVESRITEPFMVVQDLKKAIESNPELEPYLLGAIREFFMDRTGNVILEDWRDLPDDHPIPALIIANEFLPAWMDACDNALIRTGTPFGSPPEGHPHYRRNAIHGVCTPYNMYGANGDRGEYRNLPLPEELYVGAFVAPKPEPSVDPSAPEGMETPTSPAPMVPPVEDNPGQGGNQSEAPSDSPRTPDVDKSNEDYPRDGVNKPSQDKSTIQEGSSTSPRHESSEVVSPKNDGKNTFATLGDSPTQKTTTKDQPPTKGKFFTVITGGKTVTALDKIAAIFN